MNTLKQICAATAWMLTSTARAHPGHPAVSVEHTHSAYEVDPLLGLLLIAAAVAVLALWRVLRRTRRVGPRP